MDCAYYPCYGYLFTRLYTYNPDSNSLAEKGCLSAAGITARLIPRVNINLNLPRISLYTLKGMFERIGMQGVINLGCIFL